MLGIKDYLFWEADVEEEEGGELQLLGSKLRVTSHEIDSTGDADPIEPSPPLSKP